MLKNIDEAEFKVLYVLGIFFMFLVVMKGYDINNDMWFILSVGREIENYGGIYPKDMLSMHSNMDVMLQQWLYAITMWKICSYLGLIGVWICNVLISGVTIFLFYKISYIISSNKINSIYITLVCMFFFAQFINTRPYAFSNFLLLLEVYFLEKYVQTYKMKYVWFIPIISMLLINIHGAIWPLFVCVFAAYILDNIANSFFYKVSNGGNIMLVVLGCSILLALINPYGFGMMKYTYLSLVTANQVVAANISEMMPLNFKNANFIPVIILMIILINGYIKEKMCVRYMVLTIGFTILSFMAVRGVAQFYLLGCLPLAYLYKDYVLPEKFYNVKLMKYTSLIIILILLPIGINVKLNREFYMEDIKGYEESIDAIIENSNANGEEIILFTEYANGAYAEYRGLKPYVDPRAEAFIPAINHEKNYLQEYFYAFYGKIPYKTFINRYGFNYFFMYETNSMCCYMLEDPDYEIIYENEYNLIKVFHKK